MIGIPIFASQAAPTTSAFAKYMALKQPDNLRSMDARAYVPKLEYSTLCHDLQLICPSGTTTAVRPSKEFQSVGTNSDVYLQPVRLYRDPFRGGNNKLVLCETVTSDQNVANETNTRRSCQLAMEWTADQEPWFGIEQEYCLLDGHDRRRPLGWPSDGFPRRDDLNYCGIGTSHVVGRDVVEAHLRACLYAGVNVCGINAEGILSQWEFQVGPCEGILASDDLWMARFLLYRIAEDFNVGVTLEPKYLPGDWPGTAADVNFSTNSMRQKGGIREIECAIKKLEKAHMKHMVKYDLNGGADNVKRLTGKDWTAPYDQFVYGVANRFASVRIPRQVADQGSGYLEDRRPASNTDPFVVCERLVKTICLDELFVK